MTMVTSAQALDVDAAQQQLQHYKVRLAIPSLYVSTSTE